MAEHQKIAVITGASRGLGRSMALALAREGIAVVGTYHNRQTEAECVVKEVAELKSLAVMLRLDTGDASSFAGFAEAVAGALKQNWGRERFDFLVNNAGVGVEAPFVQTTEADFDLLMNVHFKGPFFLTQKLLPLMEDGGRIVNVSSGLARFSLPGFSAYAAMKGAVEVLTRYLAKELGPRGISVNTLAPGAIETDFDGGALRNDKQRNAFIAGNTALGRVGLPDDIGGAVAALLGPENRWVNAQRIEVSGGMFV